MTSFFIVALTLFIMAYGFLYMVGGPKLASVLPRSLGQVLVSLIRELSRGLIQVLLAIFAAAVQFVFDRPRR